MALPAQTTAETWTYDLGLATEHSDNRGRASPRGPEDTLLVPRLDFTVERAGTQLEAEARGRVEYRDSLRNRFDDEFRANVAGRLNWNISPERLAWVLQDVARVEPVDLLAPDSPENRQQTNLLWTGPRFRFSPREGWTGQLDARYLNSWAEESREFNSNRFSARGEVRYRAAPGRTFFAATEGLDTRYRSSRFDEFDYRRGDVSVGAVTRGASVDLDLEVGHTWIEPDRGDQLTRPLLRTRATWNPDDSHRIFLELSHELSDTVSEMTRDIHRLDRPLEATGRVEVGAELYRLTALEAGWRYRALGGTWQATPYFRDYDHVYCASDGCSDLNRWDMGLFLTHVRTLFGDWRVRADAGFQRRSYDLDNRRDIDYRTSLFVDRRLNPRWSIRGGATRNQRESNREAAESREMIYSLAVVLSGGR